MDTGQERRAIVALAACTLLPSLGAGIANVALPAMAAAFDAPFGRVQWVVLAYLIAATAAMVTVGRLGDLMGRRRLLLAGAGLFTAASLACAIAPGLPWLLAARAVQGFGAAALTVLSIAAVGDRVPKARTGRAMGLLASMSATGTALGPALGGLLVDGLGWPAVFAALVPGGVAAAWLVRRGLADDVRVGRGAAVRWAALVPVGALQAPGRRPALLAIAAVSAVMMSTLVVGPFHLARALGLPAAGVGLAMAVGPVVAALAGAPAGRLVDRFGAAAMARWGIAGIGAGSLALALAPIAWGVAGYLVPLAVMTTHYALFQAGNLSGLMRDLTADERGAVSGLAGLARQSGFLAGAAGLGGLFAFASGGADVATVAATEVARGTRITFALAAAVMLLAAFRLPRVQALVS